MAESVVVIKKLLQLKVRVRFVHVYKSQQPAKFASFICQVSLATFIASLVKIFFFFFFFYRKYNLYYNTHRPIYNTMH